ncbi:MAG: hypothetical protein ACRDJL_03520 [Actinomycetota bacterium]
MTRGASLVGSSAQAVESDHRPVHLGRTLRYGAPHQAGFLAEHVDRIVPDAAEFTKTGAGGPIPSTRASWCSPHAEE